MKNLKKQTKFKLEHFEVAKLKNSNKINGGGDSDSIMTTTGTTSNSPKCPTNTQTGKPTDKPTDKTIVVIPN